jgi:hypothetical protein
MARPKKPKTKRPGGRVVKTKAGVASVAPTGESLLIPAPKLRKMIGIGPVTMWRWRHDKAMGFPPATVINDRNYFSWPAVQAWLARHQQAARGR